MSQYKGLILTNHALLRMKERGLKQEQVWETYTNPDSSRKIKEGGIELKRKINTHEITLIYKLNQDKEVIVISCWMEPPLPGTRDARQKEWYKKYKKASFWGRLWLEIVKQFTL